MYGLLSFVLYAFSMLIGHADEDANHLLILVKAGLILASALLFLVSCPKTSDEHTKESYSILSLVILTYEILVFLAAGRTVIYIRDYPAMLNSIAWIGCSLISLIRFRGSFVSFWRRVLGNRKTVILMISSILTAATIILLSLEPDGVKFTWDAEVIYRFVYELDYESLYDAKLLTYNCHVSVMWAQFLVVLKLLLGNIRQAYLVLNSLCIICASFGMTFLLKNLLPDKKTVEYILGNAVFMLSPWVCGLSTLYIYDYYIWCLFPLMIYFVARKNRIGYVAVGVMIAFSKAPGLIVFASVCAGILFTDSVAARKTTGSVKETIKQLAFDIKYWYFISVAVIFAAYIYRSGLENVLGAGDKTFGFNLPHIIHQLKEYTITNFLWVYIILAVMCIVQMLRPAGRKAVSETTGRVLIIILISDVLFILFNCISITYRLPRYMDSHIAVVYILSVVFILEWLPFGKVKYPILCTLCVLNVVSSFCSVDPLSKCIFNTINVGDHTIVDYEMTDSPSFEDSIICNREYYAYQALLDRTLTYVINERSDNDMILFSLGEDTLNWSLSGGRYSWGYDEGKRLFDLFYDKTIQGLANGYHYDYFSSDDMIPFEMLYIYGPETVEELITNYDKYASYYYIYLPTINNGKENELRRKYHILDEKEFLYRGWKMNVIWFDQRLSGI